MKGQFIFDPTELASSDNVGAYLRSSDGTLLTQTDNGGKKSLDVNLSGSDITIETDPGALKFVLDGSEQSVTEDTVTPANNRPLPVKLMDVTGDINVTAGDLNVQLSHLGANFDSTRIGDGTTLWGFTTDNRGLVTDRADTEFKTTAQTITDTGAQLAATALTERKFFEVYNNDTKRAYIGGASVTDANGMPLNPGETRKYRLGPNAALHAITEAGKSVNVRIAEIA